MSISNTLSYTVAALSRIASPDQAPVDPEFTPRSSFYSSRPPTYITEKLSFEKSSIYTFPDDIMDQDRDDEPDQTWTEVLMDVARTTFHVLPVVFSFLGPVVAAAVIGLAADQLMWTQYRVGFDATAEVEVLKWYEIEHHCRYLCTGLLDDR
jgi:hypothetical protein